MARITNYVEPRRLYRYRSLDKLKREMKAIQESYVYCAAYEDLNDPMEGLFTSSRLFRKSDDDQAVRDAIRKNKANTGICSFSETHDHELMWAHYANQFRGICISYNFSRLLKALPNSTKFVRMYYNESVPTLHPSSRNSQQLARMVLSYKNYRWLYEREWRMFADQGAIHYEDAKCITRVYLGARISNEDKRKVIEVLEELEIPISEMKVDEYLVTFEERK
jgi:hypothetical protein